jgi:hypothetical protein
MEGEPESVRTGEGGGEISTALSRVPETLGVNSYDEGADPTLSFMVFGVNERGT